MLSCDFTGEASGLSRFYFPWRDWQTQPSASIIKEMLFPARLVPFHSLP